MKNSNRIKSGKQDQNPSFRTPSGFKAERSLKPTKNNFSKPTIRNNRKP